MKGTQSYRVPALQPHPTHSGSLRLLAGLGVLLAALLLACAPDDGPPGEFPKGGTEAEASGITRATAAQSPDDGAPPLSAAFAESYSPPARGLWVLAEGSVRVLDDPTRIAALLERAQRLGATDLFVQVYRGGRAFYPAGPDIERAPAVDRLVANGRDPLSELLGAAHADGLKVHAWVNVLSLSTRLDARMIEDLGPSAILVDRLGRSLLDYPNLDLPEPDRRFYRMGTRGIYLDPAVAVVRERLVSTFRGLLERYPELDGLHLDYIRHPGVLPFSPGSRFGVGLEFGYGAEARARYRAETGRPDPIDGAAPGTVRSASAWDAWRRHQVTTLVEEIAAASRQVSPSLVLSAAVIPYFDRAYLSLAQDWRAWLETGAIDLAIPMVYTLDDRLLRYQLETFAGWTQRDRIWPGLGVWLFDKDPDRAAAQVRSLRTLAFRGEVLFSDDALSLAPGLVDTLAGSATTR
ncbi:MAG: family 10 glycosylhydrolase [bacterium]|nr:family 10 glycosylhydrolase [bacterium]